MRVIGWVLGGCFLREFDLGVWGVALGVCWVWGVFDGVVFGFLKGGVALFGTGFAFWTKCYG